MDGTSLSPLHLDTVWRSWCSKDIGRLSPVQLPHGRLSRQEPSIAARERAMRLRRTRSSTAIPRSRADPARRASQIMPWARPMGVSQPSGEWWMHRADTRMPARGSGKRDLSLAPSNSGFARGCEHMLGGWLPRQAVRDQMASTHRRRGGSPDGQLDRSKQLWLASRYLL